MPDLSSTETLLPGNRRSSDATESHAGRTIKKLRDHTDKSVYAGSLMENGLIACNLRQAEQEVQQLADSETAPEDSNLYGAILSVTDDTNETDGIEIPKAGTIQTNGEIWFRYDSDTDAPVVGKNVGVSSQIKGKVCKKYPITGTIWADSEAQGGLTHWNRWCPALELDTDLYRVLVLLP